KSAYLVIRHPQVKRIDPVRAYTFGVLYFVEGSLNIVDIELPEDLPLIEAHAIGLNLRSFPRLSAYSFIWISNAITNQSTLF
ncbi:hypothetical protein RJ639_001836, partial [Escallonia herrerae]